jgi:hypothetical protein
MNPGTVSFPRPLAKPGGAGVSTYALGAHAQIAPTPTAARALGIPAGDAGRKLRFNYRRGRTPPKAARRQPVAHNVSIRQPFRLLP